MMSTINAWYLLVVNDQVQYAGNLGHNDEIRQYYQYDNEVPNFKRIKQGDLAIIVVRTQNIRKLKGIAKIENITSADTTKKFFRCPFCNTTHIRSRKKLQPKYVCKKCQKEFNSAKEELMSCITYTASFGSSFIETEEAISIEELNAACFNYDKRTQNYHYNHNKQFAMQPIDINKISQKLIAKFPFTINLLKTHNNQFEQVKSKEATHTLSSNIDSDLYFPSEIDSREKKVMPIHIRCGQAKFREQLRERYGEKCMITGCQLWDIIEACHIVPYRGKDDHHLDNGLLLRADLHTLFDLDLLGIHPESLKIKFHPNALKNGYDQWNNHRLLCDFQKPSQKALQLRWKQFLQNLES